MPLRPFFLVVAAALTLSACVPAPVYVGGPVVVPPTGGSADSQLRLQLADRSIRSDVFAGQLDSNGLIRGSHDIYGSGGNWSVEGNTLCMNFGFNYQACGFAEFANGALLHYSEPGSVPIGYDYQ
jgi:hypothetical protein